MVVYVDMSHTQLQEKPCLPNPSAEWEGVGGGGGSASSPAHLSSRAAPEVIYSHSKNKQLGPQAWACLPTSSTETQRVTPTSTSQYGFTDTTATTSIST